jgi:hypothetical protein
VADQIAADCSHCRFRDIAALADEKYKYPAGMLQRVVDNAPARLESWPIVVFHVPANPDAIVPEITAEEAVEPSRDAHAIVPEMTADGGVEPSGDGLEGGKEYMGSTQPNEDDTPGDVSQLEPNVQALDVTDSDPA